MTSDDGDVGGDGAVAHHDGTRAHLEDLLHVVADEDDDDAALAQRADELEDEPRLLDAERCRRFVHQHDALTPRDRAADRHRLALAPGQALDRGAHRRDVDPQASRGSPSPDGASGGCASSRTPASGPRSGDALAVEEEVGGDVEGVDEREVLVDRLDPQPVSRACGESMATVCPSMAISPLSGLMMPGEALDERRLAGAVVADEPEHVAAATVNDTPRRARTGP